MTTDTARQRRDLLINLGVNLVVPLALFYGLTGIGVGQWTALVVGAAPATAHAVWTIVTRRRIDALAVFTLSILVLSVLTSFLTGSPRFLLAKDGWLTGIAGLWILLTLLRAPFLYQLVRLIMTGAARERVEIAWRDSPTCRHVLRVATAVWGVGLILDAGVRVLLAYSLPVERVPLISGLQYLVVWLVLQVITQLYVRRPSVRARVVAESGVVIGGNLTADAGEPPAVPPRRAA